MLLLLIVVLLLVAYIKTFKEDFNKQEILGSIIFLVALILLVNILGGVI